MDENVEFFRLVQIGANKNGVVKNGYEPIEISGFSSFHFFMETIRKVAPEETANVFEDVFQLMESHKQDTIVYEIV